MLTGPMGQKQKCLDRFPIQCTTEKNAHIAAKFQWVTEHICALQNDIVVDLMLAQECQDDYHCISRCCGQGATIGPT